MKKGASRAVLKIVEQEMHEAWRKGYEEGLREIAEIAVAEIIGAHFGPEARASAAALARFTASGRLAELVVRAATCTDFASFYHESPMLRKRRRKLSGGDRALPAAAPRDPRWASD
jgi:hypothetical protein